MENKSYIFLDFDGVMVTGRQHFSKKLHPKYNTCHFDKRCVDVLNSIIETTNSVIVASTDWKLNYTIPQLNEIIEYYGVKGKIIDITPSLWGVKYFSLKDLEPCRAEEILLYVKENNITKYVAIDDLDISKIIPDNSVICRRYMEGIKQTGIKEKIIKILT